MTYGFDKDYWESHWQQVGGRGAVAANPLPRPRDQRAGAGHRAGRRLWRGRGGALARGGGSGHRRRHLRRGARARGRGCGREAAAERVHWVEADLSTWQPEDRFDLVTTHYAQPGDAAAGVYARLEEWVAPGRHAAGRRPPARRPRATATTTATATGSSHRRRRPSTAASITAGLDRRPVGRSSPPSEARPHGSPGPEASRPSCTTWSCAPPAGPEQERPEPGGSGRPDVRDIGLAVAVGFEPTEALPPHTLSRRAP